MNWNIPFTTDRTQRAPTIAAFLALVAVLGVAGIAVFGGGVVAEEVANESVEITNDTGSIYVEATFNDSTVVSDENATATVTITDSNGTTFVDGETISGNASETIVEEFELADTDPIGTYNVTVDAEQNVVASADVGTFSANEGGGGGGSADDADGWGSVMGYPIWIVVIAIVAAVLLAHSRGWIDLSEVSP